MRYAYNSQLPISAVPKAADKFFSLNYCSFFSAVNAPVK